MTMWWGRSAVVSPLPSCMRFQCLYTSAVTPISSPIKRKSCALLSVRMAGELLLLRILGKKGEKAGVMRSSSAGRLESSAEERMRVKPVQSLFGSLKLPMKVAPASSMIVSPQVALLSARWKLSPASTLMVFPPGGRKDTSTKRRGSSGLSNVSTPTVPPPRPRPPTLIGWAGPVPPVRIPTKRASKLPTNFVLIVLFLALYVRLCPSNHHPQHPLRATPPLGFQFRVLSRLAPEQEVTHRQHRAPH